MALTTVTTVSPNSLSVLSPIESKGARSPKHRAPPKDPKKPEPADEAGLKWPWETIPIPSRTPKQTLKSSLATSHPAPSSEPPTWTSRRPQESSESSLTSSPTPLSIPNSDSGLDGHSGLANGYNSGSGGRQVASTGNSLAPKLPVILTTFPFLGGLVVGFL
ncbi:hypothetical protein LOZ53_006330 [Ophidiomyces ophidiicola]|nr:hypothetical protein LOZ55_004078 [Ophidiomyces ophidiicola]KAI1982102.1 hypothetical protein LOZ53_006330 [Ophidiomyces ophidiicola]KAI1983962.1 hypothetical protein LOZ54_004725 [Ophidiomyces ophidiicola]KAI1994617.1 hypothetical protein LOZ51_003813 [Ophidiomyces ophidiicola]